MLGRVSSAPHTVVILPPSPLLCIFFISDANTLGCRTMVWAIDLDDGSLLAALSSVSTKKKEEVLPELDFDTPDFGTNWDFIPKKDEKVKRDEL